MTDTRPDEVSDPDEVRDTPQTSSNQSKTEPVSPSPAASAPEFAAPSADREPDGADVPPEVGQPPVPSPGFVNDENGHIAVSTNAAQGTSEQLRAVEGIRTTAVAQPGKPDGEVAT